MNYKKIFFIVSLGFVFNQKAMQLKTQEDERLNRISLAFEKIDPFLTDLREKIKGQWWNASPLISEVRMKYSRGEKDFGEKVINDLTDKYSLEDLFDEEGLAGEEGFKLFKSIKVIYDTNYDLAAIKPLSILKLLLANYKLEKAGLSKGLSLDNKIALIELFKKFSQKITKDQLKKEKDYVILEEMMNKYKLS